MDIPLTSLEACSAFLSSQPPSIIASRLLQDQATCRSAPGAGGGVPSMLVYCLPPKSDAIAIEISKDIPGKVPISVARMRYANIVANIKTHLATLNHYDSSSRHLDGDKSQIPAHLVPTNDDFNSALKVIRYFQLPQLSQVPGAKNLSGMDALADLIQSQLHLGPKMRETLTASKSKQQQRNWICYICKFRYTQQHRLYASLCHPCGEFNISSSALSLPSNLDLRGKTALVTGGRVNLGYHTALRLLRCGASVVVSTRYPHDAEERYRSEPDAGTWIDRLRIVGADFRTAKDVFALVRATVECLRWWGATTPKLDVLVNNAAQTLTDEVSKEEERIRRELELAERMGGGGAVQAGTSYTPRVRGGHSDRLLTSNNAVVIPDKPTSSWVQQISEIPYEDVISAHSVNTFVPFILIRELMPYLRAKRDDPSTEPPPAKKLNQSKPPVAYVINVSSREGLPERRKGNFAKDGQHVHTNMSKAALNMLTETEAGKAWKNGRVAINSVDPGYMSADPVWMKMLGREAEEEQDTPLDWEDGVGRVLWVVAKGEREKECIWGKFFKHFVEIDPTR